MLNFRDSFECNENAKILKIVSESCASINSTHQLYEASRGSLKFNPRCG